MPAHCISLVCGLAVPLHRQGTTLRQPHPCPSVHDPEIELGICISLVCGLAVPLHRQGITLRQPTPAISYMPPRDCTAPLLGLTHCCAILADGAIVCWGNPMQDGTMSEIVLALCNVGLRNT